MAEKRPQKSLFGHVLICFLQRMLDYFITCTEDSDLWVRTSSRISFLRGVGSCETSSAMRWQNFKKKQVADVVFESFSPLPGRLPTTKLAAPKQRTLAEDSRPNVSKAAFFSQILCSKIFIPFGPCGVCRDRTEWGRGALASILFFSAFFSWMGEGMYLLSPLKLVWKNFQYRKENTNKCLFVQFFRTQRTQNFESFAQMLFMDTPLKCATTL